MSDPALSQADLARIDPRELIQEAYRMEGLAAEECRSIFFDWALGRSEAEGDPAAVARLHAHFAALHPDHPMTAVLLEGQGRPDARPRRGRRRG
ncbi:hypothetical protein ACQ5SO_09695 [Rhodovulum sp. DZ06]|uniref:hypothetical protein n=1 Tax=Rhodovulum sp. DZ06 TaxID=3425126 RepID=UPI003D34B9A6